MQKYDVEGYMQKNIFVQVVCKYTGYKCNHITYRSYLD